MKPVRTLTRRVISAIACLVLTSCASEIDRVYTVFTPAAGGSERSLVIETTVDVSPSTGYSRTLKAGSTWNFVGRIAQGAVYRIEDDVFMLEGKHMHEAYCVIVDRKLVGFYLPVEQSFVPLSSDVLLPIR